MGYLVLLDVLVMFKICINVFNELACLVHDLLGLGTDASWLKLLLLKLSYDFFQ